MRVAHLEIAPPGIGEGIDACVAAGATEIVVHPYFLSPGRHTSHDIPRQVEAGRRAPPGRARAPHARARSAREATRRDRRAGQRSALAMSGRFAMSCVWFFCLGGLGLFFPYFSLYLRENAGLSGSQVGVVLAMVPLVGTLAQPLWGQLADRTGARARVLALLGLGAATGYLALGFAQGFAALVLATLWLALFSTALVPAATSVTFALARGDRVHAFGRMRVWGTIGFLALVVGFPRFLDRLQAARGLAAGAAGPSEPGLDVMFPITAGLIAAGALLRAHAAGRRRDARARAARRLAPPAAPPPVRARARASR